MNENVMQIEKAVIATLPNDHIPTEEEILDLVERFKNIFQISGEEYIKVLKNLHYKLQLSMDVGVVIKEDNYESWLPARKPEIEPFYWDRYAVFLKRDEGWAPQVVVTLDRVTDEILDLLGNPIGLQAWYRRGLVMGEVQSGKTATYTALCCKAADAGYRLIIILTGTLENVRRQTQERLDEGFVGLDSSERLTQKRSRAVGVGTIDFRRTAGVFTSQKTDFRSGLMNQLGFRLNSFKEPILVVVKKNAKNLENLEGWLRSYNADSNGKIDTPMLLIDDEADNASVNTNKPENEPTSINERIRALLHLFTRRSYVGFTATPFANIFIDPENEDEMVGNDLFPRDFIYALEAPSNYIGANAIFGTEAVYSDNIFEIDDAEDYLPSNHKSNFHVDNLPDSLIEALYSFILANAIRDLRGDTKKHRSMLVNVSRFTDVQDQVAQLIDEKLKLIQQDIRNYSMLNPAQACLNNSISTLKKVWEKIYANNHEYSWNTIQHSLIGAALPIIVKPVNRRTGAASLNYKAYKQNGLRVIAVGGNCLSRGLTLEGLCTSYFLRNSQMYDTLMQMGRWFGFRKGYEDLCRIWMTEEAIHWYSHITLATEELRSEIRRMYNLGFTPREFGLKVRAHPDSLIVTARNKMRTAHTIERMISLNGKLIETPRLYCEQNINAANFHAMERFINELKKLGYVNEISPWGSCIWYKIPRQNIIAFLREYNSHPLNFNFQPDYIAEFLEKTDEPKLDMWDVVIPNGSEEYNCISGISFKLQKRTIKITTEPRTILVSGASARVGSRGVTKEGLSFEEAKKIRHKYMDENEGKDPSDEVYLRNAHNRRPLLILHFIKGYVKQESSEIPLETQGIPLVAVGMGLPVISANDHEKCIKYRVNLVEWRNWFAGEYDDYMEDEDDFTI